MPAGSPIRIIPINLSFFTANFFKSKWHTPLSFIKHLTIKAAETNWDNTVAVATPATSIWNPITKIKFKITFTTPAAERKYNGRFVSPIALNIALPKLYSIVAGMPKK